MSHAVGLDVHWGLAVGLLGLHRPWGPQTSDKGQGKGEVFAHVGAILAFIVGRHSGRTVVRPYFFLLCVNSATAEGAGGQTLDHLQGAGHAASHGAICVKATGNTE